MQVSAKFKYLLVKDIYWSQNFATIIEEVLLNSIRGSDPTEQTTINRPRPEILFCAVFVQVLLEEMLLSQDFLTIQFIGLLKTKFVELVLPIYTMF